MNSLKFVVFVSLLFLIGCMEKSPTSFTDENNVLNKTTSTPSFNSWAWNSGRDIDLYFDHDVYLTYMYIHVYNEDTKKTEVIDYSGTNQTTSGWTRYAVDKPYRPISFTMRYQTSASTIQHEQTIYTNDSSPYLKDNTFHSYKSSIVSTTGNISIPNFTMQNLFVEVKAPDKFDVWIIVRNSSNQVVRNYSELGAQYPFTTGNPNAIESTNYLFKSSGTYTVEYIIKSKLAIYSSSRKTFIFIYPVESRVKNVIVGTIN